MNIEEILEHHMKYLVPAGWGESNVNAKKKAITRAAEAIRMNLAEEIPPIPSLEGQSYRDYEYRPEPITMFYATRGSRPNDRMFTLYISDRDIREADLSASDILLLNGGLPDLGMTIADRLYAIADLMYRLEEAQKNKKEAA